MTAAPSETKTWGQKEWDLPPSLPRVQIAKNVHVCPVVGIPLPDYITSGGPYEVFEKEFEKIWYEVDPIMWEMLPFKRDEWFNEICENWKSWLRRIRWDSTPRFYKNLRSLRARGGGVIVVSEKKGEGKSILAQMVGTRLLPKAPVRVIWEHADLSTQVTDEEELQITIIIDEDLLSTGEASGNLIIHIDNVWQTIRKTELFVVSTGVKAKGNPSVDLWIRPCGINRFYQATRCVLMTSTGKFIGWAVFQRKHRPEDEVYYYNELATWSEYEARAKAYSVEVIKSGGTREATTPKEESRHIQLMKNWLDLNVDRDSGEEPPVMDQLITYAKRLGIPSKTTSYVKRIIRTAVGEWIKENPIPPSAEREPVDLEMYISEFTNHIEAQEWPSLPPKDVLKLEFYKLFPTLDERINPTMVSGIVGSVVWKKEQKKIQERENEIERMDPTQILEDKEWAPFWKDYARAVIANYPQDYKLASRDAQIVTYRMMGLDFKEIKKICKPMTVKGTLMRANSIQERFYHSQRELKVLPTPTQLGTAGERLLGSRIDSHSAGAGATVKYVSEDGSAARDTADILIRNSQGEEYAVNVKVDMSEDLDFDRTIETSPEHEWIPNARVAFLFPLLGKVGIASIEGENTRYNSADLKPFEEKTDLTLFQQIAQEKKLLELVHEGKGVLCGIEAAAKALLQWAQEEKK